MAQFPSFHYAVLVGICMLTADRPLHAQADSPLSFGGDHLDRRDTDLYVRYTLRF